MSETIEQLKREIGADPGSEKFPELAKQLSEDEATRAEAREICFRGLTAQPGNRLGRLILARLFYLDGMYDFAARELAELQGDSATPSVTKLIAEFGERAEKYLRGAEPGVRSSTPRDVASKEEEGVVAEISLDSDFIEALNDLEKE